MKVVLPILVTAITPVLFTGCFDEINNQTTVESRPTEQGFKENSQATDFDDFEFEAKEYKLYLGADGNEDRDKTDDLDESDPDDENYVVLKSDPDDILVGLNGYQLVVKDVDDGSKLKKYNIRGIAWTPSKWEKDPSLYTDQTSKFVLKQADTQIDGGEEILVWGEGDDPGTVESTTDGEKVLWANGWGGQANSSDGSIGVEDDEGIPLYHWDRYRSDFDLMVDANINTLRVYYHQNLTKDILDEIDEKGLKIIVNLNVNFNFYNYPYRQNSIKAFVDAFKDHPAILMWMIGNEWDLNKLYSFEFCTRLQTGCDELSLYQSAQVVREAAMMVRSIDEGRHPIATSLGSQVISLDVLNILGESIDIIAYQKYEGLSLGTIFAQHNLLTEKPMMFSEFGADSWDSFKDSSLVFSDGIVSCSENDCTEDFIASEEEDRGEPAQIYEGSEDRKAQADALTTLIGILKENANGFDNSGTMPCIGGIVFALTDEHWKGNGSWSEPNFDFATWAIQEPKQIPTDGTGPHPDKVYNEEFWGILDLDRNEKPAYNAVKNAFAEWVTDENSDGDFY